MPLAEAFPLADHQQAPGGSPFPPIADYGFLSDCEVSALLASSGNIEWMCLPRMDGPSVFAAMLDRGAGALPARARRRARPGEQALPARHDDHGNHLVGADGLGGGPRRAACRAVAAAAAAVGTTSVPRPTTRPSSVLLRTVQCLEGAVDLVLECEPAFDYGRHRGAWRYVHGRYGRAECAADGQPPVRLTTDLNLGFEGPLAVARHRLRAGEQAVLRHVLGRRRTATGHHRGTGAAGPDGELLARVDRPRHLPRPSLARVPGAVRAHAQGPHLRAHRRPARRGVVVAA